jgi:hypothetical protein
MGKLKPGEIKQLDLEGQGLGFNPGNLDPKSSLLSTILFHLSRGKVAYPLDQ